MPYAKELKKERDRKRREEEEEEEEEAREETLPSTLIISALLSRRKPMFSYLVALMDRRGRNVQWFSRLYLVSPFGSVPLKTKPDGDIDLTALAEPNSEHLLPEDVWCVLEMEKKNHYAKFEVQDVQLILAEVKLVKCLVQNIVVDISFNQVGGLNSVLEEEKITYSHVASC